MTLRSKQGDLYVIESLEKKLLARGYVKVDIAIDPGQYSVKKNKDTDLNTINWCEEPEDWKRWSQ